MEFGFVNFACFIVGKEGKDILNNRMKIKALFMDYSHNRYKNEVNLLLKTIELGYPNKIKESKNIEFIKTILIRQLTEDHYIIEKEAIAIINLLVLLVRGREFRKVSESCLGGEGCFSSAIIEGCLCPQCANEKYYNEYRCTVCGFTFDDCLPKICEECKTGQTWYGFPHGCFICGGKLIDPPRFQLPPLPIDFESSDLDDNEW